MVEFKRPWRSSASMMMATLPSICAVMSPYAPRVLVFW